MLWKLAILIVSGVVLLCTLYTGSKGNGIGGGGYDLSELVYSCVYTLFVVCWNIWMTTALLMSKTALDKQNNKILLIIGVIVLIASATWFFRFLR
ncbi:hypothetical protein [uncultured Mucilaginibacter sp.]|uniref:hypothetical protein n=1 Tax=uncultured Mucilaginibacter sp. TaxID=797541 RepID=UPI0025EE6F98|nr:hypothetical protein [uncultured Mucilaginibacter sp.]